MARDAAKSPPGRVCGAYRCVLPDVCPVTLGEGWPPMLPSPSAFRKEEGANPTGSFKARGLGLGRHHGASLWRARACRTASRQRGRRARGIGGRHQRTHFHAARCSLRQLRRGGSLRCEPHSGQRSYFGLRANRGRAQQELRLFDISTLKDPVPR
jgi:hypothetical protein